MNQNKKNLEVNELKKKLENFSINQFKKEVNQPSQKNKVKKNDQELQNMIK